MPRQERRAQAAHARQDLPSRGPLSRLFGRGKGVPGKPAAPGEPAGEPEAADAAQAPAVQPDVPQGRGERIEIPRADGSTLRALLVLPEREARGVPGFLWIHGDDPSEVAAAPAEPAMAQLLGDHRPCVVLCLDHPANVADCHLALSWLCRRARAYGVDADQLMVGGEGSGANLAIQLSCFERDQGLVSLAWQLPLYPSLDADWREGLSGVARHFGYKGLPATTTIVGMDDFSREATIAFVEAMREDGVEVDFHMYRGHFSGTGMWGDTPGTREAKSFILRQFDEAVATLRSPQPNLRDINVPNVG